jgi:type VI protein secretion system component Hcp
MRDKNAKTRPARISPQAGEANTSTDLGETELKDVTGGKVTMQDFYFTMKMNKSSPG